MGEWAKVGRRHWRWSGEVPGAPDAVRSAVVDALRLLSPSKLSENDQTVVARVGGTIGMSWAATEEITVGLRSAREEGTRLDLSSRSVQWSWSDSGRNRANLVTLLGALGIDAR